MAIPKPVLFILALIVVPVSLWGSYQFYLYREQIMDPCLNEGHNVLAKRYPDLQKLLDRQRVESDQLMASQRAEDLMMNMELSPDSSLSPEETLKMSTNQIDQIAQLREKHDAEFLQECRRLTK